MIFNLLIAPRRGEPIVDGDGRASRRMTEYMELNASIVNQVRTEIIELGDWDMVATPALSIAHGLVYEDIISAEAFVRNNANTEKYNIGTGVNVSNTTPQGFIGKIDSTNIDIIRLDSGRFDNVFYNATSYNRGWLIVTYINQ